jgi:hypothetical protein
LGGPRRTAVEVAVCTESDRFHSKIGCLELHHDTFILILSVAHIDFLVFALDSEKSRSQIILA